MKQRKILAMGKFAASLICIPVYLLIAVCGRLNKRGILKKDNIRIVWGTTSLTNYKHWSCALELAGWNSRSVVTTPSHHSSTKDFNMVIFKSMDEMEPSRLKSLIFGAVNFIKAQIFFCSILLKTNLVMHSCEGLLFHNFENGLFTNKVEFHLLKIAKIKVGVIPYGRDGHIYRRLRNPNWLAGLLSDYPFDAKRQKKISKRVDFYVERANIFLPGSAILDGFGRSDIISANTLCIDTDLWAPAQKKDKGNIVITHSPNHRRVKGTNAIISAVNVLREEGYAVELILIEGKSNEEVRVILQEFSDIHVDQLNSDSYALSAIESMSLGIPTVSSFGGEFRKFFSDWSFAKECPIVNADSYTLLDRLRELVSNEDLRSRLSVESRRYALNFHSYDYFSRIFNDLLIKTNIIIG